MLQSEETPGLLRTGFQTLILERLENPPMPTTFAGLLPALRHHLYTLP